MKTEQRSGMDRRQGRATAQARLRAIVERLADGIVIVGWEGWSPDALSREWGILREEIDRVIRQGARALPSLEAFALIERRIEQAKEIGIRALHRTRNETVASGISVTF